MAEGAEAETGACTGTGTTTRRLARPARSAGTTANPDPSETTLWAGLPGGGIIGLVTMLVFVVMQVLRLRRRRPVL